MPGYLVALLHSKMSPREHMRTSKSGELYHCLFVCVDVLHPSQQYSVMLGQFPVFLG